MYQIYFHKFSSCITPQKSCSANMGGTTQTQEETIGAAQEQEAQ
jgi:hypothetical protein